MGPDAPSTPMPALPPAQAQAPPLWSLGQAWDHCGYLGSTWQGSRKNGLNSDPLSRTWKP